MTPQAAAQWMLKKLNADNHLVQEQAVWELRKLDPALTYQNDNGNLAISKSVLAEFNKLTKGDDVVWSRSERLWRFRAASDVPGKRMQD